MGVRVPRMRVLAASAAGLLAALAGIVRLLAHRHRRRERGTGAHADVGDGGRDRGREHLRRSGSALAVAAAALLLQTVTNSLSYLSARTRLAVLAAGCVRAPGRGHPRGRRSGATTTHPCGARRPAWCRGWCSMRDTGSTGSNAVDWEQRVDFDRLRDARLARVKAELDRSELGAVLAFDFSNIRYMSSTHIGTWAMDKLIRFSLLTRNTDPVVWDFGSAAKHHSLYNPWLDLTTAEMDADPNAPHEGAKRAASRVGLAGGHLDAARRLPARRRDRRGRRAEDQAGAREVRCRRSAARRRCHRIARAVRASARGHPGRGRAAGLHGGEAHQDLGRDPAPDAGGVDGGCRLRGALPLPPAGRARERGGGPRCQDALRPRKRVRRGRQRDLGRAVLAASSRLQRPADPPGRPGLLRHPALLERLPHVLLPYVRGRSASSAQRDAYTRAREYMDRAIALVKPVPRRPTS